MRIVKRFENNIICIQNEESVVKRGRLFARLLLRAYYSYFAVKMVQRSLRPSRKSGTIVAEMFVRSRLLAFFREISTRAIAKVSDDGESISALSACAIYYEQRTYIYYIEYIEHEQPTSARNWKANRRIRSRPSIQVNVCLRF